MAAFGLRNILSLFILANLVLLGSASSHWERELVEVNQGDNATIRCYVTDLVDGMFDIVRLFRRKPDGKKETITDKTTMSEPFLKTERYRANYTDQLDQQKGIIEIHYTGIRGEDAGEIGCMRLADDPIIAYMRLKVLVPVRSVNMIMIQPGDVEIKTAEGSTVHMKEGQLDGVGCQAKVDGSSTPPQLIATVDGVDVTDAFVKSEKSVPKPYSDGRLARQTARTKLTYVELKPSADYNGKNLTCIASMEGVSEKIASVLMDVQYTPLITCPKYEHYGQLEKSVIVTCLVRSNPGSAISWTHGKEKESAENIIEKAVLVEETPRNEDELEVKLTFNHLAEHHFTKYHLSASNDIGNSDVSLELLEGSNPDATPAPQEGGSPSHQGSDKPSQNAPEPAHVQSGNGSSSLWPGYSILLLVIFSWLGR